ncbi:IS1 family transposase [Larkinella sp. GY13]|uniref:IS1 family transposase n=1 Tax=Larkinella sp. GY13 TaxID=3453720 RepID=UPI003EEFD7A5
MFLQHNCPDCGSTNLVNNGHTYYGKARRKYKQCGRQFVSVRQRAPLSTDQKRRIELLLAEPISLEGICRVLEIKAHQLYAYMDELYAEVPTDLACSIRQPAEIELHCLDCETDELWSFVLYKANKQWVWVALDRATRQVLAVYIGDRGAAGAFGLWQAVPDTYRHKATFHTDDWDAYKQIIPPEQHRFSKQKKHTNHVERFFCTLRQRASRLVRLSLSFSKKLDRHINSIRFVVMHYNLSLQV